MSWEMTSQHTAVQVITDFGNVQLDKWIPASLPPDSPLSNSPVLFATAQVRGFWHCPWSRSGHMRGP